MYKTILICFSWQLATLPNQQIIFSWVFVVVNSCVMLVMSQESCGCSLLCLLSVSTNRCYACRKCSWATKTSIATRISQMHYYKSTLQLTIEIYFYSRGASFRLPSFVITALYATLQNIMNNINNLLLFIPLVLCFSWNGDMDITKRIWIVIYTSVIYGYFSLALNGNMCKLLCSMFYFQFFNKYYKYLYEFHVTGWRNCKWSSF